MSALQEWAQQVAQIQVSPLLKLQSASSPDEAGLGWFAARTIEGAAAAGGQNALVLTVPSKVALTVECPGDGPDDAAVAALLASSTTNNNRNSSTPAGKQMRLSDFPWYVQMAVYLFKLDRVSDTKQGESVSYRPWLDALPRQFLTPLHWGDGGGDSNSKNGNDDAFLADLLQYDFMVDSVRRQRQTWKRYHEQLNIRTMTWEDFVWGCECARSRAFSGTYTGGAFNPSVYAFTLLLVTLYVGAGWGTLEQAANGAGLVICVSILKGELFGVIACCVCDTTTSSYCAAYI